MQNRHMERSAAYSGILGALLFVASGIVPGAFPPVSATAADISAYVSSHAFVLMLGGWLTLPAVAFIIWFAMGFSDYLRGPDDRDRTLAQWGSAGVIIWAALMVASTAVQISAALRTPAPSASLPVLYVLDIALFVFGMGAFGLLAFALANESRRKNAMPSWLNLFGYLVFIVDVAYTLSVFSPSGTWSMAGIGAYVAPFVSALWIIVASIVLLTRTSRSV